MIAIYDKNGEKLMRNRIDAREIVDNVNYFYEPQKIELASSEQPEQHKTRAKKQVE